MRPDDGDGGRGSGKLEWEQDEIRLKDCTGRRDGERETPPPPQHGTEAFYFCLPLGMSGFAKYHG